MEKQKTTDMEKDSVKGRSMNGPVGKKPGARHVTVPIRKYELQPHVPILLLKVNDFLTFSRNRYTLYVPFGGH